MQAGGASGDEIARQLGISTATLYNWRNRYGAMDVNEAKELKRLRDENDKLKRLVAGTRHEPNGRRVTRPTRSRPSHQASKNASASSRSYLSPRGSEQPSSQTQPVQKSVNHPPGSASRRLLRRNKHTNFARKEMMSNKAMEVLEHDQAGASMVAATKRGTSPSTTNAPADSVYCQTGPQTCLA